VETAAGEVLPPGFPFQVPAGAEPGQAFTSWSGDATGADNPLVVTMDKSKTITANFTNRPRLDIPDCFGLLGGGGFRLLLEGEIGTGYSIEKSFDLREWTVVATITNALGVLQVDTPTVSGANQQFYRAVPATPTNSP